MSAIFQDILVQRLRSALLEAHLSALLFTKCIGFYFDQKVCTLLPLQVTSAVLIFKHDYTISYVNLYIYIYIYLL